MTDPYTFPRKWRSCLNCVHQHLPFMLFGGKWIGGCIEKMGKNGPPDLRHSYCGQWYLRQLDETDC